MKLKEMKLNSSAQVEDFLSDLSAMIYRGEVVVKSGSLESSVIDCTVQDKSTGERWHINGVNDVRGGLAVRKV